MNKDFRFKPYIKWVIFAAIVIYAVIMIVVQQKEIKKQTAMLNELIRTEEELSDRIESLEGEIGYMQTDEYIERTARERLGMIKENEIIFKEDPATAAPTETPSPAAPEEE